MNELECCAKMDAKDVDTVIMMGILNWSLMENKKGYECFWSAYKIDPTHE
jgi:hypothetical protein